MDHRRHNIILFVLQHQMMILTFLIVCLLTRHQTRILARRIRQLHKTPGSYTMTQRITAQMNHLRRVIKIGNVQCVVNLRMNRNAFTHLCYLLNHVEGLGNSKCVHIEEKVAMFLSILVHHQKHRIIAYDHVRRGQTISVHFP